MGQGVFSAQSKIFKIQLKMNSIVISKVESCKYLGIHRA